jgi:hypothetical protein
VSAGYDPELVAAMMTAARYSALVRTGLEVDEIATWDPGVLRDARLLVPVDLQALYVPVGTEPGEPMVRLPSYLRVGEGEAPLPPPFAAGTPRPPGVHLHWALPDALLRGRLREPGAPGDRLELPALPDRWAVVRIIAPPGRATALVRGWVLEAENARAVPFALWPAGAAGVAPEGEPVPSERLTAAAGGTLGWVATYDGTLNRFAFHDPLDDLTQAAELENAATYLVAGWYSQPRLDPLDGAYTGENVHERVTALGWTIEPGGEGGEYLRGLAADARAQFTLSTSSRYGARADGGVTEVAATKPDTTATTPELQAGTEAAHLLDQTYTTATGAFANVSDAVFNGPLLTTKATLLHGVVHGVPVRGPAPADLRPAVGALRLVLGRHAEDLAAGLAAPGLASPEDRRDAERLLTAFTGNLLRRLGSADGVAEIEEREHAQGFASLPAGDLGIDRLVTGKSAPATAYGRPGRTRQALAQAATAAATIKGTPVTAKLAWADTTLQERVVEQVREVERQIRVQAEPPLPADAEVREVPRLAPRLHLPLDPVVALSGGTRSLRFGGDGRGSPDGMLHCRWPSQVARELRGVLDARQVLVSLGSGALPEEVLLLAREALLQSPYLTTWLGDAAATHRGVDANLARGRFLAEAALRFGAEAAYRGTSSAFASLAPPDEAGAAVSEQSTVTAHAVAEQLRRFSVVDGDDPDLVGVTAWVQPWLPVWLEWEAQLAPAPGPSRWRLGAVDLELPEGVEPASGTPLTFTGRSPLAPGTATQLGVAIDRWLEDERARDLQRTGEVDEATAARLARVRDAVRYLDVLTATLDGIREQLLGLPYDSAQGGVVRVGQQLPVPTGPPTLVVAGGLTLTRARLVDTFGRTLDLDVSGVTVPVRSAEPDQPTVLALRPRFTRPSRWMFRLVDAASTDERPPEASIDQADPTKQVSPVCGFLLPDHIDEALEVFDAAGTPLGQLMHEPVGGGVTWEIAPGREGPSDAGPGHGLAPAQAPLGWFAAGLVAADAATRAGQAHGPIEAAPAESALSALLRVIDTTLWSFDPYAALGAEHVAGLVGRPLAMVRARVWLEVDDDLDETDLSDPGVRAAREAAYRELAEHGVPVRVGELTRTDDGLLAFFADDDYGSVRVVDKVVAELARESGRLRGYLTTFGAVDPLPGQAPVQHPYVAADDELRLHLGQVVTLTLLMHPGGAVNLTSGVLPRKSLRLARDWVAPGLAKMAPSVRVGPVLVDPENVRMPKVASLGREQTFTRRQGPYTWRDDPILAATQAALLPEAPAEAQEGWVRVTPEAADDQP